MKLTTPTANVPMKWPPLVGTELLPLAIRVRDDILTVGAWGMLGYMLRDALYFIWDYLRYPIFELTNARAPDWLALWQEMELYAVIIAALMTWSLVWGHYRRDTLAAREHRTQPAALPVEEHARALGLRPEDVLAWQAERSLVANFSPEGAIVSMDPWPGNQRQ
jgi:poly-beta-1,6-N-acetyl-D-glucosamine biosynthesis protein PgaD